MDRATNLLTLLGALLAASIIIYIGAPADWGWWKNAIGPIAWALCPYAVMWLMNNVIVAEHRQRDLVLLVTAIAMVSLECVQLGLVSVDALQQTVAAVLHNLPVIQLTIAVVGGAIAYLMPVVKPKR